MQKFNKATAAIVVGALLTALGAIFPGVVTVEVQGAIATVVMAAVVYMVPNV